MKSKKLSPRNANNHNLLSLQSDNKNLKDYWLLVGYDKITITKQSWGEGPEVSVKIPRRQFNILVDWYIKEQEVK